MATLYTEKKSYQPKNPKMSGPMKLSDHSPLSESNVSLTSIIRNAAGKLEEGDRTRWFTHQIADRVQTVETAVTEFLFGRAGDTRKSRIIRSGLALAGLSALVGAGIYLGRRYLNSSDAKDGVGERNTNKGNSKKR